MKHIRKLLLGFLVFGLILSCARTRQRPELHPIYTMPHVPAMGKGIPFSVAEGFDAEKVEASTVRVVYGESSSPMISSGFFVANNKIATNIHVVADADLASLHVSINNVVHAIRGVTAFDANNDLVILEITGEGVPLALGDSDAISGGETVFCTGYVGHDKFNAMENTVLPGRLSGGWLRVTPTTLPGNSGGPVVDAEGKVIGINVAGSGPIGYVIGSNVLKELLKQTGPVEPLAEWRQRDPIRAYTYIVKASGAFYDADYAGAVDAIDEFISLIPAYANMDASYSNRGYARTLLGHSKFEEDALEAAQADYRVAIQDFDKAIRLNSKGVAVYVNRGFAKIAFGHSELISGHAAAAQQYYRAAIEDYNKAINSDPEFLVYTDRGVAKVSLGVSATHEGQITAAERHYYAAIADFDKAISINQRDTYAYIIRGYAKILLGDYESNNGNIADARKLYKSAIKDGNSAINSDFQTVYGYHIRGIANAALDDYGSAIEDFDKSVSLKPDFARAYYNRALVKVLLGKRGAAKADFKKAKELDSSVRK